ncbi:hypothetical protein PtB15_1B620 [Puccinia triticina]|nr:hypothetical protein PtB15_1B620 [Puccinia triticina]
MAESSTSTGSDAPQAPEDMGSSRNEQHWPLGDLVVDGLNGLEKHMRDPTVNPDPFLRSVQGKPCSDEQADMINNLLRTLHSNLLPQLRHQITNLARSLDPNRLANDPGLHLKLILEIQSALDETLSQINHTLDWASHDPQPFSGATKNDQHLQEFKFFRLVGLRYRIKEVCGPVNGISIAGVALIQRMQCSTKVNMTSSCLLAIELAIGWLEGSEFDLVQHHWSDPRRRIDECLERLLRETADSNKENRIYTGESPSDQISKSAMPIVKLSRLFFKKTIKTRNEQKTPPLVHRNELRPAEIARRIGLRRGCSSPLPHHGGGPRQRYLWFH